MKKVTINDLAKITGFSKSTVSYALNNKEGVGEEARAEILRRAEEMGYIPNFYAKSIASGDSRTIGVILRDLTNPFYANVFCAIDKIATANNYQTLFYNLGGDPKRTRKGIDLMKAMMVSGIVLDFFGNDETIERDLVASSIPTVVFGTDVSSNLSCISTDDESGARAAVDYGVRCGYRHLYYVTNQHGLFNERRRSAISDEAARLGIPFGEENVIAAEGDGAAERIVAECPRDSLLVCYNDLLACAVISGLMKRKLYVPADYGVIGFDNLDILPYSLTTVEIPQYRMAEEAMRLLLNLIEKRGENEKITLQSELIIRHSVRDFREP